MVQQHERNEGYSVPRNAGNEYHALNTDMILPLAATEIHEISPATSFSSDSGSMKTEKRDIVVEGMVNNSAQSQNLCENVSKITNEIAMMQKDRVIQTNLTSLNAKIHSESGLNPVFQHDLGERRNSQQYSSLSHLHDLTFESEKYDCRRIFRSHTIKTSSSVDSNSSAFSDEMSLFNVSPRSFLMGSGNKKQKVTFDKFSN